MNVLTMVTVLRPDVTSLLCLPIGQHVITLMLNANWLKIIITSVEGGVQTVQEPFLYSEYWNYLDLFD